MRRLIENYYAFQLSREKRVRMRNLVEQILQPLVRPLFLRQEEPYKPVLVICLDRTLPRCLIFSSRIRIKRNNMHTKLHGDLPLGLLVF